MRIEENSLKHWIDNFYGYGSWDAPIWFISREDGGGDLPEEVAEKLDYFSDVHTGEPTLCNIRALYKHTAFRVDGVKPATYENLFEYRFGRHAVLSSVWKNLIAFAHAYRNEPMPEVLTYQKKSFASQLEALIKLYPLPAPHNHAWYYSWLDMPQFPFLKSRALYQEHLYPRRINTIIGNILRHQPELVLMYGMENINALKKSVLGLFPNGVFTMVKAEKGKIPQHHKTTLGKTTLIITTQIPALRHNRVETGFDWVRFGKKIKSGHG